jgi:hypothetical protein
LTENEAVVESPPADGATRRNLEKTPLTVEMTGESRSRERKRRGRARKADLTENRKVVESSLAAGTRKGNGGQERPERLLDKRSECGRLAGLERKFQAARKYLNN